jgi:hypothetical protein
VRQVAVAAGVTVFSVTICSVAPASTVLQWDFNAPGEGTSSTGTTTPSVNLTGAPATVVHVGGTTGSTFGNGFVTGDSSSPSFPNNRSSDPVVPSTDNSAFLAVNFPDQGEGNKTAGVAFTFDLTGFTDAVLSFDMLAQTGASRYYQVQYDIGDGLIDFATIDVLAAFNAQNYASQQSHWILGYTFDFGSLLDNQESVEIRVVSQFAPGTSAYEQNGGTTYSGVNGQVRWDMVTVTAIPEPSTAALLGLATALCLRRRR